MNNIVDEIRLNFNPIEGIIVAAVGGNAERETLTLYVQVGDVQRAFRVHPKLQPGPRIDLTQFDELKDAKNRKVRITPKSVELL